VTSDITNFWTAYDAGGASGNSSAFQTEYLDKATPGLRSFIAARNLTAASLTQMVRTFPRYFAAIRENSLRLSGNDQVLARIRSNYDRIKSLYPTVTEHSNAATAEHFKTGQAQASVV
jgi:hypothetical protein